MILRGELVGLTREVETPTGVSRMASAVHDDTETHPSHSRPGRAKEIVVKIEYKYCPNLTIIDTPGLISAPSKGRASPLQGQARAVEALVKQKMENRDYIILGLEDTSDWSNATTRNLVLEVRGPPLRGERERQPCSL
jgi:hypothetical protein